MREETVRDDLRESIAQASARLITAGLTDYHAAKLKAARQFGLHSGDTNCLPDNYQIEAALRQHHKLFACDTQPGALKALRQAAIQAMRWLADFSPWLTGAVLVGSANEFSAVELELIGVEAKSFEMFLITAGVEFDIREHRQSNQTRHGGQTPERTFKRRTATFTYSYEITLNNAPIEITIFENHTERQTTYPHTSLKHDRAQLDGVIERFDAKLDGLERPT